MGTFLSRRRYEVLALAISLACAGVHVWADSRPVVGVLEALRPPGVVLRTIQMLEGRATDVKFRARGPRAPHPDVVVIAIDERSVQRYGLWPWSRSRIAEALRALHGAGARAVALDIDFTDEANDSSSTAYRSMVEDFDQAAVAAGPEQAARFASFRARLEEKSQRSPDLELARAFVEAPEVVQGVITFPEDDVKEVPPEKVREYASVLEPHLLRRATGPAPNSFYEVPFDQLASWYQYSAQTPLPLFARAGNRFGFFNEKPDPDGPIRRTPLLAKLTGPRGLLPSLAVQAAAAYYGTRPEIAFESDAIAGVRLRRDGQPSVLVPFAAPEDPFLLINHVGAASAFHTLSVVDVIDGKVDPGTVRGKLALVGVTVVGNSGDQRVTPFEEMAPGVYVHASVASNILAGDYLVRRGLTYELLEGLAMVLLALLLGVTIPRLASFWLKGMAIAAVVGGYLVIDQVLFAAGSQIATVMPVVSMLSTSFGLVFLGYLSMDQEKFKLRSTFSKYLGADVMEEALKYPEKLNRGEKREMTVLFSDIRGFTTLSERMAPEQLAAFIKEYLTPMTQIVFDEKGTLDKYIGDALMAFWNAPIDQPDHAFLACRASVAFLSKLEELKTRWRAEGYPAFDIGVGVNTGTMIVGNMGSDVRSDYTVMGDAVNLASRLEGTNKDYETRIILSETTWASVKDRVAARRLGAVRVKGKHKPVGIYELRAIGRPEGKEAEAIGLFERGVEAYVQARFDDAATAFRQVEGLWPGDPPSRRYLDEIVALKAHPPGPGWDGVYTATHK